MHKIIEIHEKPQYYLTPQTPSVQSGNEETILKFLETANILHWNLNPSILDLSFPKVD